MDHVSPDRLVAEEGHDHCRLPGRNSCSCSPSSAVMDNARDVTEEPVMRAVAQHENVRWFPSCTLGYAGVAPAFWDNGADSGESYGFKDNGGQGVWVVYDDGSESDIDRRRPIMKKRYQMGRW